MKRTLIFFLLIISLNLTGNDSADSIEYRIKQNIIEELYKFENQILKETYGNNMQIINIVLTLSLLVMGFMGFYGLKDIEQKKKDYQIELEKQKSEQERLKRFIGIYKSSFDKVAQEINIEKERIIKENTEFKTNIDKIHKELLDYQKQLDKLEIFNRIKRLHKQRALEDAKLMNMQALKDFPNDENFLFSMAEIYFDLQDYPNSKFFFKSLLEKYQDDETILFDICELSLFEVNIEEYNKYKEKILSKYGEQKYRNRFYYLDALEAYVSENEDKLIKSIENYNNNKIKPKLKRDIDWIFDDFYSFIATKEDTNMKKTIVKFIKDITTC